MGPWSRTTLPQPTPVSEQEAAELYALRMRAAARLELQKRERLAHFSSLPDGPLRWLTECVLTEDPHYKAQPIRPFPREPWAKYLEVAVQKIVEFWMNPDLAVMLVEKSRRMMLSWLSITLHVWAAQFIPHEMIYFGSRKLGLHEDEGSLEMVKRAKIILQYQQGFEVEKPADEYRDRIVFPATSSHIIAVAQGKHQMRGPTATKVLLDEFASWEEARETWTALRPTIEGKGKILAVSTPYPGLMKDLVFDAVGF